MGPMDAGRPEQRLIWRGLGAAIAGPVYAAAVILDAVRPIEGLRD